MFRRLLSTAQPRLNAALPANVPSTASGLGFAQRAEKRVRQLDLSLAVPASTGKIDTGARGGHSNKSRAQRTWQDNGSPASRQNQQNRTQPQSERGPSENRGERIQVAKTQTPRQDRKPRPRPTPTTTESTKDDFFADIEMDIPSSEPLPNPNRGNAGRGRKQARVEMSAPSGVPFERRSKTAGRSVKRATPRVFVARVVDASPAGLFGRVSMLNPVRRGARDLRGTLGAEGVEEAQARRQEVRRLAGDYSLFAPKTSPGSLSFAKLSAETLGPNAKELALRVLAQNATISLRGEREARGVLDSLIR